MNENQKQKQASNYDSVEDQNELKNEFDILISKVKIFFLIRKFLMRSICGYIFLVGSYSF